MLRNLVVYLMALLVGIAIGDIASHLTNPANAIVTITPSYPTEFDYWKFMHNPSCGTGQTFCQDPQYQLAGSA